MKLIMESMRKRERGKEAEMERLSLRAEMSE